MECYKVSLFSPNILLFVHCMANPYSELNSKMMIKPENKNIEIRIKLRKAKKKRIENPC